MNYVRTKGALGLKVYTGLLAAGLAAGCASSNANFPTGAYANRQATIADAATFFDQGPIESKIQQLRKGMAKEDVIRILGKPDQIVRSAEAKDDQESLFYLGRFLSGWSWERADYVIELHDGKVMNFWRSFVTKQSPPSHPDSGYGISYWREFFNILGGWGNIQWGK